MLMLKRPNVFLPGGFAYTQDLGSGRTMQFDGNTPLRAQIHKVLAVRKANNLPRATLGEAAEDVAGAICGRHPGNCIDTNQPAAMVAVTYRGGCGTCGGRKK